MKKLLSIILVTALVLGFASCKKTNSSDTGSNPFYTAPTVTTPTAPTLPVGSVPNKFTKKVVIEEFTGEWCGACPGGAANLKAIVDAHPDLAYPVAIHNANSGYDPYEPSFFNQINSMLGSHSSYPGGNVDRGAIMGASEWAGEVDNRLQLKTDIGVALVSKTTGDNVNLDIYFGVTKPLTKDLYYTVYLLENDMPTSPQGQTSGGAGYKHEHVLKDYLTTDLNGDMIEWVGSEKYFKVQLKNKNIGGKYLNINNCHLLVIVHTKGNVGSAGVEIITAQECSMNEIKKWD